MSERDTPIKGWLPLDSYLDGSKSMTLGDVDRTELSLRLTIQEKKQIKQLKEEADAIRNGMTPSKRILQMRRKPMEMRNRLWRIELCGNDIRRMKKSLVDLADIEKHITERRQKSGADCRKKSSAELRAKHKIRRDSQRRRRLVSRQENLDHEDVDENMDGASPAALSSTNMALRLKERSAIAPANNTAIRAYTMALRQNLTNSIDPEAKRPAPALAMAFRSKQTVNNGPMAAPPAMCMSMVFRPRQTNNIVPLAQPPGPLMNMVFRPRNTDRN